jgi:hypothetical protein
VEFTEASKIVFGAVTAIGTIAVTFFNISQEKKIKAELLDKLETAIERSQKHSVAELFRFIHGLRMKYSDIVELVEHDECSKIIYAIKKNPRIVTYNNGKLEYTKMGRSKAFQFFNLWIGRFGIIFFSVLSLISFFVFAFVKGPAAIFGHLFFMISIYMLTMHIREREYDEMITFLIEGEQNKDNLADTKNRMAD